MNLVWFLSPALAVLVAFLCYIVEFWSGDDPSLGKLGGLFASCGFLECNLYGDSSKEKTGAN
jgi:hypothetical protein